MLIILALKNQDYLNPAYFVVAIICTILPLILNVAAQTASLDTVLHCFYSEIRGNNNGFSFKKRNDFYDHKERNTAS